MAIRRGAKVTVKMAKGPNREGKYVGEEENRGTWYVIQPHEKGSQPFKARPANVTPL
jgi:hypothetical protein